MTPGEHPGWSPTAVGVITYSRMADIERHRCVRKHRRRHHRSAKGFGDDYFADAGVGPLGVDSGGFGVFSGVLPEGSGGRRRCLKGGFSREKHRHRNTDPKIGRESRKAGRL
jgi:hypothetical protein